MRQTITVAPRYCSFYVAGALDVEIPLPIERLGIIAASGCINIPARYWNEGDTTVMAGTFWEVALPIKPDFDGEILTPGGVVILFDANEDNMMTIPAGRRRTRIRIWINHPTQPDEVRIAVGE